MAGKVKQIENFDPSDMAIYIMAVKNALDPPEIICRWGGNVTITSVNRAVQAVTASHLAAFAVICTGMYETGDMSYTLHFKVLEKGDEFDFIKILSLSEIKGVPVKKLKQLRKMFDKQVAV
ncbi:MAG: hypothetical protein GY845_25840 [Planctomycetes bacterium]|nr:hypothetical protein [Planctomycetota bacterium]